MPDKKYLIEIPGMPEGSGVWDADKWERNKDLLMSDYPDANVFELGQYDADDARETDQIMLDLGNEAMSGVWDNAKWERNKDLVMSDYPDVQVSRVRYVDYWGQRAEENRARKAQLQQPDADRNSRLAEIGYYDDLSENQQEFNLDSNLSYGLKPLSSAIETNSVSGETTYLDPRVKEFFANDSAETERQAEISRLDAEYETNPSVIAQREWEEAQRAERAKYAEELKKEIQSNFEANVDLEKAAEGERAKYAHFGAGGRHLSDVADIEENAKKERYAAALKLMEKAAIARDVAGKGFGGAVVDWTKERLMDLVTQDDIETYNEIGNILTRLENEIGDLKPESLTEEVFEKYLTKDEQAIIKSFYEYNAAMAEAQQDMSKAYKGGKIFAESVPFMLEFLATGGVYKAAGKAATKGLASALAKWVMGAAKGTAGRVARKVAAKVTRDAIYAGVGTLARTVASPGTYDRMAEASIQIDEDGHLNRAKNAAVAFADMYVENLSEISGKLIGDTFGLIGKGAGKLLGKVPLSKIGGMLGDNAFMQGLAKLGKGVESFMPKLKALGFHGLPEEVGEEFIGNAIREISGIQPGALKEMVADDNFGAMLIGFAPMTMLGVAGGIYNLGVVNAKAAQLGKDLREKFGSTYSEEELDHMMGVIQNAQTAEDIQKALKPMAMAVVDSFEKGMITQEEMTEQIEMLYQYGGFMAQNNALLFGKKAQDRQMMDAKREEFTGQYGRFWQEDQSETVQIATLNNGSTVFVTSAPAADGKITTIDVNTGKKGFANVSDIATQEVEGEQIQSTNSMTMDAFLNAQIATQRKTAEETRMNNERNAQIQALAAQITPGTRINLGTEGSPVYVFAKRTNKNGVVIVDETGMESTLGWEKAAYALGQPIKVETDQEKLDAEIAARLQRMAERRMQRSVTPAAQATEEAAEGAAEVVAQEQQNIPLNEDGTVNEALFWTQDPEGYVKWNDEQNKDGGQDSLKQIAISKQELFGMLQEAATGQNTSNPTMRKAAEKQVAAIAEKIARLEALEMSYADALAEEKEAVKQTAATPTATMNEEQLEQMDTQYQGILGKTRIQGERVRVMQEYLNKLAENSAPIRVLTKDNYEEVMRAEGCPEDDIKRVGIAIKTSAITGAMIAGFASNGVTFVMADTISDVNSARITYIHERQHLLNSQNPEIVKQFAEALGDRENALRILETFVGKNGLEEYKNDPIEKLADEIICRSMEIVYSTENYSVDLQNKGLPEEAINIINTIDNGQRTDKSLASARRFSHASLSQRENAEEDGRNIEQVSGGILGREENGSLGSSSRGDGVGGQGSTGEGAEVNPEGPAFRIVEDPEEVNPAFVEAISTDVDEAEYAQFLDDKAFADPQPVDGIQPDDVRFSIVLEDKMRGNTQAYFDKHYNGGTLGKKDQKLVPLNVTHFTQVLLDAANAQIEEMRQYMLPYLDMESKGKRFLPAEVYGKSTLFDNSSYGKTMENTLICTRTLAYIDFVEEVKKRIGRPLTATESFLASQMLYDIAVDPQCLYCYVSLDRKAYDEFLLRYIQQRDEVISKWNASDKSDEAKDALYKEFLNGRKPTAQMQARFESWLLLSEGDNAITPADLATKARRGDLKISEAPEAWEKARSKYQKLKGEKKLAYAASEEYQTALWNYLASPLGQVTDAEAYAQSASWAKKEEDYRSYTGELLNCTADALKGLMGHYGLRFYSFSEYSPAFILENMQMVRDAAARGLKGFAYTKEIDFIKIFAPTGMNINCSVYGRVDSEGNVVPDTKQGADWAQVQALREQYPNVGAVFVATNDEMVEWALNQPWIDVIIPFHIVRTGADIAKFYEWTNYSSMQADTTPSGKTTYVFPHEHHNDKTTFLKIAQERGLSPRFADVKLADGRSIVEHPNYMRLVNETRRSVDETPILTPTFNVEAAKESFDAFVAKGGYYSGYFYEDDAFEQGIETVVEDIKAGKTAKDVDYGRQDVPIDVAKIMAKRAEQERKHGKSGVIDLVAEAEKAEALHTAESVAFRFIGEKGAQRIDQYNQASMMMNLLDRARVLEQDLQPDWTEKGNAVARRIKMATGWERGADGMWRYEEPDFKFKGKPGKKKTFKLKDLIKDETLFVEYPELADMPVKYTKLAKGKRGELKTEDGKMWINLADFLYRRENPIFFDVISAFAKNHPDIYDLVDKGRFREMTPEQLDAFNMEVAIHLNGQPEYIDEFGGRETLAHEIQHAIQHLEGFARGGNRSMVDTTDLQARAEYKALSVAYETELEILNELAQKYHDTISESREANRNKDFKLSMDKFLEADKYADQWRAQKRLVEGIARDIRSMKKIGHEGYHNLAGEVEARNVAERIDRSFDERRKSLYNETQDVNTKDQIFLRDNIMMKYDELTASDSLVPGHKKGQPMLSDAEMMADISFRITKNTKSTIETWFNKAGVDAEMTEATINYLDYAFEDTTEQLCAAKWYLNGKISLPDEDEYKVRDAVKVAKQNKVDALSYASPMDILNTFGQPKSKVKAIDPDTVKEFSNKKELAEGIVVYDVQDDFEGQAAVRKIIDTHWGEDANPWCLAARTNGDMERAKDMWLYYSKYPKRIAFRNGRLLAFYASANDKTWWDRNDEPHSNIPYSVKSKEGEYEVSTNYELKEGNKKAKKVSVGKSDKKGRTANFVGNRLESAGIQDGERNLFYSSFPAGATLSDTVYGVGNSLEVQYGPYKNVTQVTFERRSKDEPTYYVRVGYGQNGVRAISFVEGARSWDIRYGINGDQIFVGRAQLRFNLNGELDSMYSGAYSMQKINDEYYEFKRGAKKVGVVKKYEKVTMKMLEEFGEDGASVGALLDFINDMGWDRADYPYPNPMDADLLRRDDEVRDQIRKVENEINEIAGGRYLSSVPAIRFRVTAEQDKAYMDAVEAGDMETAQRMVIEAARLAMPNTKVVDENGNPKVVYHGTTEGNNFTIFDKSIKKKDTTAFATIGFWFGESESFAKSFVVNSIINRMKYGMRPLDGSHVRIIPAFVNITDPLIFETSEKSMQQKVLGFPSDDAYMQYKDAANMFSAKELGKMADEEGVALYRERMMAEGKDGLIIKNTFFDKGHNEGKPNTQYAVFSPSQIKSAEPVTYDDNGNVIPLSERFNPEDADIRFRVRSEEEREKLFADAKAHYGVTDNFNAAGYMLPDGSLLDFSEANDGGDPNSRSLDHRDIEGIIMENGVEYDSRWMYIADFMNEGAIRLLPESAGINMIQAPTEEQRKKIFDFIYKYNGEVILEINDERLNSIVYMEYDRRTSPSRIFRDIDGYFNNGIIPQQDIRFRMSNENQAIFVSNAARAVEGIKQEKATPEQWLKMIEKNGGLKAGEDKWMGLSDWLKASDKKTLTKQEVLDFINENMIVIEEQHYSEDENALGAKRQEIQDALQGIFDEYVAESEDMNDDMFMKTHYDYAIQKLADELGYTAFNAPFINNNAIVELDFYEDDLDTLHELSNRLGLEKYDGTRDINDTRLSYTTEGLTDRHEIALTVPTIEPWNERDDIHFGDAGDGRAIAWIRFGETDLFEERVETPEFVPANEVQREIKEYIEYAMRQGDDFSTSVGYAYNQITDAPQESVGWTEEEVAEVERGMRPLTHVEHKAKVLVIDEIQSKRHQEGRENGYRVSDIEQWLSDNNVEVFESGEFYEFIKNGETDRRFSKGLMNYDIEKAKRLYVSGYNKSDIPDAPFDKNWHELAMKRMLRYAAENGYDVIAWTTGDQQADRYDLSRDVKKISASRQSKDGERIVNIYYRDEYNDYKNLVVDREGKVIYGDFFGSTLADVIGKEMALQIMSSEESTEFKGEGLKIGGEGMRGFYDKMLPAFMNKYGKKWGVKVEDIELPNLENGLTMHSVPVTEEMKASVMEGQVMFRTIPITQEVQDEMDAISATAIVRGDYLKAPNGADTNLTPEQWAMVRTKAFMDWFGDWEFAAQLVDVVSGTIEHGFANFDEAREWARNNIVRTYSNAETGQKGVIEISNNAIKKYLSDSAVKKSDSKDLHLAVLKHLPEIIRTGVIAETHADHIKNENGERTPDSPINPDVKIHRVFGAVEMNGNVYRVKVTIKEHKDDNRANTPHSYEATKIELLAGTLVGANSSNPNTNNSITVANLLENVDKSYEKGKILDYSKVVDENGEPLVIWRGMSWDIMAEAEGDAVMNPASYFSNEAYVSRKFGEYAYPYFMNARNPYIMNAGASSWSNIPIEYAEGLEVEPYDEEYPDETGIGDIATAAFAKGYDAVWVRDVEDMGGVADQLLNKKSNQIKAADNNTGEFSEKNDDIRFRTSLELDEEFGDAWRNQQNEDGRHSTQVANTKSTYEKIGRYLEDAGMKGASILDASSGLGLGTHALREMGFQVDDVEPFPSENREAPTFSSYEDIDGKYDVVISNAVLNVIPDDWRADVLHQMADAVKEGGKMIINTRPASNIAQQGVEGKTRITLDSPSEILVKRGDRIAAYQKGFTSEELAEWIKSELGEGWRVEKATKKNSGISGEGTAVVIKESDDTRFRTTGTPTDEVVANGLNLTPAQTAEVAANIFAALPEESRKKITDGLNGNILGLKDAILQIPTSLATKENWDEEDTKLANAVRTVMQDAIDKQQATSRPLTTKEALWMLYDSTNTVKDLVDAASRAFIAHRLGFDQASLQRKAEVDDYVRFRTASNGVIDAATDMYNFETSLWTERLKESWLDMNQSVISLQKAMAEASGMPIEPWENLEFALNRLSSKSYADKKKYLRDFLMPMWDTILDIVKHDHVSIEDIERYMMLKHGLERNKKFASRDAKEFYRAMYDVVAERMKSQSHAQQVVALSEANKALADIRAKMANATGQKLVALQEAEKKAMMDVQIADLVLRGDETQNEAELQAYYDAIDNEMDPKYREFREKDYGGLTSMFVDTTPVQRSNYKSEEAYQQAVLAATTPKFTKVADMEAEAKSEVDDFENKVYMYKALWDKVNAATKETLRHQYESGMITLEQYEAVRDMFDFYVPLRGFADNTAEDMYSYYMTNSAGGFTKPILAAKGRKTRAESPLGWIGTMAESAIQADNKNEAKMCLYYITLRRPDQNLLTITETWYEYTGQKDANGKKIFKPAYPPAVSQALSAGDLRQHMDTWEADMKQKQSRGEAYKGSQKVDLKGSVIFQDVKEEKEHIVRVKVAGKDYSILINGNPRAAQAINGLLNPDANVGPVAQWIGNARRNLSALLTSYSPLFWIANYQRDLLSSVMRVSEADGWDTAMKYLANRRKAWRVASYIYKYDAGTLGDTYYEKLYKEFAENGGITGYTALTTNKEYEELLKKYANNVDKHVLNAVKGIWDKFMGFGEAIEQVSRFAAFITAREEGKSIEEAINAAKEVSVNFNRKGSAKPISLDELDKLRTKDGKELNKAQRVAALVLSAMPGPMKHCYYFVNASIQALSSSAKLAKKSPGKATTWVGMYMGTSIALAMLNYLLSDDDDDEYLNLPDYLRHSTALVKVADGYYFKWSIPQEMRPFYAWADILVRKMMGKMPHKSGADVGKEMALAASQWLPVNPFEAEDPLLSLVPDFASPFAEIKANTNAFGGKIYNDMTYKSEGVVKEIPAYRKATERTGDVYVDIAEFLNDVSGGNESIKGKININPAIMEHLIEGYGGGIYDFAKGLVSIPSMILSDDPVQIKEIPFVNKVILSVDETNMYSHTNEAFRHYKDVADNAKRVEKEYRESDNPSRADDYQKEEDWRIYLLYKEYEKDFKDVKERLDNAVDKEEEDLLKQEQNVLREMFLEDIAKGDIPEVTFQIREDVKRIDKEIKEVMKPVTEANKERLERRRAGDVDGMLKAIDRRDSLKLTPDYIRAEELKKDLKIIKDQLEELSTISRGPQRDSVVGELQKNYDNLIQKMNE